jgi:hypothetical protein
MSVKYSGTNPRFQQIVDEVEHWHISEAVKTGRFRSKDKHNRERYPLTAALLDVMVTPYSKKLHIWHHCQCLRALKRGVELDFIDIETEDL